MVNSGFGIFTSVSGTAPNRIFNIEWRAQYFPGSGSAGFELRLYEGQLRFDVIYGTVSNGNTSATAGVQRDNTFFTQVLLQRLRRRCDWRTKLCLYPGTLPNSYALCHSESNSYIHANAYTNSNSHRDSNRYGYTYSYSHTYTNSNSYSHAHTNSNTYSHGYCNGNVNSHAYSNSHVYAYSNAYWKCPTYCNPNGYCYRDCDSYSYCDHDTYTAAYSVTKGYSGTKASADSRAAADLGSWGAIADSKTTAVDTS